MDALTDLAADTGLTPPPAPSGQAIARIRYTHEDMVDFIIANPHVSQNAIASRYGFTPAWVSRIIASDAFQERLSERRREVVDPAISASMDERFRALAVRSLEVLMKKLENPAVSDEIAVKAAALGAKALGLGMLPPVAPSTAPLEELAHRIAALRPVQLEERVINGQATIVRGEGVAVRSSDAGSPEDVHFTEHRSDGPEPAAVPADRVQADHSA